MDVEFLRAGRLALHLLLDADQVLARARDEVVDRLRLVTQVSYLLGDLADEGPDRAGVGAFPNRVPGLPVHVVLGLAGTRLQLALDLLPIRDRRFEAREIDGHQVGIGDLGFLHLSPQCARLHPPQAEVTVQCSSLEILDGVSGSPSLAAICVPIFRSSLWW